MWLRYDNLPKEFGISGLALKNGDLDLILEGDNNYRLMFDDYCIFKVGFESDLHDAMPDNLPGYASHSMNSPFIDEFMVACDPARRPDKLVHSIIFDFVSVVEVLSENLPKIEKISK